MMDVVRRAEVDQAVDGADVAGRGRPLLVSGRGVSRPFVAEHRPGHEKSQRGIRWRKTASLADCSIILRILDRGRWTGRWTDDVAAAVVPIELPECQSVRRGRRRIHDRLYIPCGRSPRQRIFLPERNI